ncbi:MAG: peptidoglycan DD-metalloendopeptidase family protein [Symplocastrum torsivum CPER-KK1]|jgi:murein DD-endopeptidase MepM/ murein hydrolase activator NlpD|uniref:Peptidoglycan DD-metalloendopeptidase family protein n=1 Tax=Symplocastrum torsivum CPER-KK1 TaxID=450513 RepID=A0A951UB18_9CYAN|nr:peptidoglycan DD-metalloendopeptidase family protein [Symplocastrum torsivum CPER-KK1]
MGATLFGFLTQLVRGLRLFLLCWLLAFTLVLPVQAEPTSTDGSIKNLRQIQEQIEQQRSTVEKERDRLSTATKAAQEQLSGIQQDIQSADTAYKDYASQIEQANKRLKTLQIDIAKAEQGYYQKQAAAIARLRFLQRQRVTGFGWDILLKSQNLNEFIDQRRRVKLVYQADQQSLLSLKSQADHINQQKKEIEQQKNQIALLTQQLLAQKAQFEAQLASQQELVKRLNSDRLALEAAQEQLEADSKGIGILIQRIVAAGKARLRTPVILGTGQLTYPSDASITSSFGWRRHPILGYSRFHSGIDFGASYGSTIRAADRGTVIFAGWYGGYGYTVVIDHGGSISTLYGHSSKLYVSEGQSVQRGQAIAAVGSTGLSTGPHLHFEVRKDGAPVDPSSYL